MLVQHCSFTGDVTSEGAVFFDNVESKIDNVSFVDGYAFDYGGAGIAFYGNFYWALTVTNCRFESLRAMGGPYFGGAIIIYDGTNSSISSSSFKNCAGLHGGALGHVIYETWGTYSSLRLSNLVFDSNSAIVKGGAVYTESIASVVMENVVMQNNGAAFGGAFGFAKCAACTADNTLLVRASEFTGNNANTSGGSAHISGGGTATFVDSKFTTSNADDEGGAIYNDDTMEVNIAGTLFEKNTATYGGAIANAGGNMTMVDSRVHYCTATEQGGAVEIEGNCHFSNCTFEHNSVIPELETLNCISILQLGLWGSGWHGAELSLAPNVSTNPSFSNIGLDSGYSNTVEVCLPPGATYFATTTGCEVSRLPFP